MKNFTKFFSTLVALLFASMGFSQISVTTESDATILANNLIGSSSGVTIVSTTYTGSPLASGTFTAGTFGISEGILLTSGHAVLAVGPNTSAGAGVGNSGVGDPQLDALASPFFTNDAAILTITFIPTGNSLEFSYVFASEEYNEYVCTIYNDVFGFFVDGGAYTDQNIALIPGTSPPMPVTINNVNNGMEDTSAICSAAQLANSAFFVDNAGGLNIEYDGHTTVLTAVIAVVPGTQYTIKLAIADAGDAILDSGVFLAGESFVSVTCDAGTLSATPPVPDDFCSDDAPNITPSHSDSTGMNDSYVYVVTDGAGNIMAVVNDGDSFNPSGWALGEYSIYGISYSGTLFGVDIDGNIGNVSSDGCFDMSEPVSFVLSECNELDCPELGGDFGDPCPLNPNDKKGFIPDMGIIGPNCTCIPPQVSSCTDWQYFLADYVNGVTTIYRVALDDVTQEANLTVLKTLPYEVHIAYNESNDLLYLVQKSDGSFQTLDVSIVNGALSAFVPLSPAPISGCIQTGFAPNGKLIIGSQDSDEFVSVNTNTGAWVFYATGNIFGGDVAFDNSGQPFFATRSGGTFFELNPGFANVAIGSVPTSTTGLSLKDDNSFLVSANGSTQLLGLTHGGASNGAYDVMLNGSPFTTTNGDMTSGCVEPDLEEGECTDFSMFYVNHDPSLINGSDLYRVIFTPTDAILTFLTNVPFEAHIGFDAMNDIVYFVEKQGTLIRAYDPTLNVFLGDLPLTPGPNAITAVVFNPTDGMLYVGDASQNKIFTIDPSSGTTTFYANAPIAGGDLAIQGGTLYLSSKAGNALYDMTGGVATLVGGIPAIINGTAQANNATDLILSNRNTTVFTKVNASTSALVATYDAMLNGAPFTILNGDMAAGCADEEGSTVCEFFPYYFIADNTPGIPNGRVFSGAIVGDDFVLTFLFDSGVDGHMAVNNTNGNIYVISGTGNSLKTFDPAGNLLNNVNPNLNSTYAMVWNPANGMVYVGSDNANAVYEVDPATGASALFASGIPVSGGDLALNSSGELFLVERVNSPQSHLYNITSGIPVFVADVAPAVNGMAITANDGFIMAQGQGSLNFHLYDGSGTVIDTLNSIDVAGMPFSIYNGDMASGCLENAVTKPIVPSVESTLTTYPNPTTGNSKVVFNSEVAGKTQVEIYDMSGRRVSILFDQFINANQEYRIDFNGSALPNGVYIIKLTTNSSVEFEKLLITH